MELYHKITKEVLELLLKEGEQMPVDLARKLQRSSSNMQQVREYLSTIKCIEVKKIRNFYELKITVQGVKLLEFMRAIEKIEKLKEPCEQKLYLNQDSPSKVITDTKEKLVPPQKTIPTSDEVISRGGRKGILKRFG